jgi:hypothetical protein
MSFTLFYLSLLGAFGSSFAKPVWPMPPTLPQQNFTITQCEANMDGHLPYSTPKGFNFTGNVRRYYVTAEYINWDYAPTGKIVPYNSGRIWLIT